jgi:hypothetical protein
MQCPRSVRLDRCPLGMLHTVCTLIRSSEFNRVNSTILANAPTYTCHGRIMTTTQLINLSTGRSDLLHRRVARVGKSVSTDLWSLRCLDPLQSATQIVPARSDSSEEPASEVCVLRSVCGVRFHCRTPSRQPSNSSGLGFAVLARPASLYRVNSAGPGSGRRASSLSR